MGHRFAWSVMQLGYRRRSSSLKLGLGFWVPRAHFCRASGGRKRSSSLKLGLRFMVLGSEGVKEPTCVAQLGGRKRSSSLKLPTASSVPLAGELELREWNGPSISPIKEPSQSWSRSPIKEPVSPVKEEWEFPPGSPAIPAIPSTPASPSRSRVPSFQRTPRRGAASSAHTRMTSQVGCPPTHSLHGSQ